MHARIHWRWLAVLAITGMSTVFGAQEQGQDKPASHPPGRQGGRFSFEMMLRRHDANHDGKVTAEEFQGPKQLFARADRNGDGTVTREEFEAAMQQTDGTRGRRPSTRRSPGEAGSRSPMQIPEGVELLADLAYRDGNEKWRLDLAMPKDRGDRPRPGLVIIHGGGWRSGDKGGGQWRSLPLEYASKGYVAISVNYRLTDEAPFPACVEDVKCAVRWLRANAEKYNVDPQRIGAYGNSAGAHLVAMLGLVGPDAGLEGDGPYQDQSSLVQAVCCSATPTDFSDWGGRSFRGESTFLAGPAESLAERIKKASPISYVRSDAPPFLVIHGTSDSTVPFSQAEKFVEALKKAGAKDVTFLTYEGAGHGVFTQHADETRPAMEAFFAGTLKPADPGAPHSRNSLHDGPGEEN